MFWTRLASGIVLLAIALVTVIMGGSVLFLTISVLSLIGMVEIYKVFHIHNKPVGVIGYISAISYFILLYIEKLDYVLPLLVLFFLLCMTVYVFTFPNTNANDSMASFFGMFYVAVLLSYVYLTRKTVDGAYMVWLIFISSWGCDTCAYCVGMLFGKHKMAPKLSPKKSIEGAIGGIVGTAIIGGIFGMVCASQLKEFSYPELQCAIICAIGAVISQIGDLAASAIKRNHNIKDYGKLIPGHGGVLDRFDSIIFTAPIIYYAAELLRNIMA